MIKDLSEMAPVLRQLVIETGEHQDNVVKFLKRFEKHFHPTEKVNMW